MSPAADKVLDERGKLCPLPIIALGLAASKARPGARLVLISDDPASAHDVPAWCRMRRVDLVTVEQRGADWYFTVRLRA